MRILKIVLTLFFVWSVADFIVAVGSVHSPQNGVYFTGHGTLVIVQCLVLALIYAVALYGIHKRAVIAWKLGWVFIAAAYLGWLLQGLSLTRRVPEADSPGVAFTAVVIAGAAVAVYWGFWWNKQKSYFVKPARDE